MSVYYIAQIKIHDHDEYQKYLDGFFAIFEKYNGEFLASNSDTEVVEGEWAYPRTALMKFKNEQDARDWHASPEYRTLARHRRNSARSNLVLVHGI